MWPIPDEFYILLTQKYGYNETLKKIHGDFDNDVIPRGKYENLLNEYNKKKFKKNWILNIKD